jgi:predicted DNA-binding transcriptional regulator AlpA
VSAIDPEEFVDATEVAQLLGLRHRNSVSTYMKRYHDFPRPVIERGARRSRFWARADVLRWAADHPGERRADG